jgi:DNA-binding NtrC family response regulator
MPEVKGEVLIVDDDREMRELLKELLEEEGYETESVPSGEVALQRLGRKPYDLLITDLRMDGLSGLALLQKARGINPKQTIILITAFGTVESAIDSMKEGAFDYIIKPFKAGQLLVVVQKAFEQIGLQKEVARLREAISREHQFSNIIGKSKAMQEIFQLIRRLSDSTVNTLISGESGTGKEMVAKAIHYNSPRKNHPFVAVNCAAIPEALLESELFGHVRGAFTDAHIEKRGMFEEAHRGTLFLDEIGEIPIGLQPKILRAIEEKAIRKVGSTRTVPFDLRILSATNRDLLEAVREKKFRDDLYYRINVLEVKIPPLRSRREDIPLLASHFLARYGAPKKILGLTESALHLLIHYSWPGNVRELENVIERAVTLTGNEKIGVEDLPPALTARERGAFPIDEMAARQASLADLERDYIEQVLSLVEGNKVRAAQILQIDRKTLYRRLRDYAKQKSLRAKQEGFAA